MREETYELLKEYGFNNEQIIKFDNTNEKLFIASNKLIEKNFNFFESKGLNKDEVIKMMADAPYLLTIGSRKKQMLDDIYEDMFTKEELKDLIIRYADTYMINPEQLAKVIKQKGKDNIRNETLINPNVLSKYTFELS